MSNIQTAHCQIAVALPGVADCCLQASDHHPKAWNSCDPFPCLKVWLRRGNYNGINILTNQEIDNRQNAVHSPTVKPAHFPPCRAKVAQPAHDPGTVKVSSIGQDCKYLHYNCGALLLPKVHSCCISFSSATSAGILTAADHLHRHVYCCDRWLITLQ